MSSTQSSPGGEGDGVGEEDKFLKADKKENMWQDPRCTVHYRAQNAFLQGDTPAAHRLLMTLNQRELMDDEYHHELFLENGHNHRLIFRNNLAILKEATLARGSAEVLFRVGLDEAFKYTKDPWMVQSLPPIVHEKLEREMDMVRYNMALSWLMNPNHSRAAFTALIYGIKHFPMDTRLWLHTAEACVAFLCSKTANKRQDFLTPPLSPNFELSYQTKNYSCNIIDEADMVRAYFPELGDDTVLPTFDFAEMCLLNARRLARPEDSDAEESRFLTILTTSAYVALRLRKFRSSLDTANKVLESNNVPRVQKVLATCYRDLSLFLLGEANWTIFTPIVFEGDGNECTSNLLEEATRKFLSNVNATRKYHNILGFVMDSADSKTAMSRLEEYVHKV